MSQRPFQRLRRSLALLLLLGAVGGVSAQIDEAEPLSARAFQVRYRTLSDAADIVGPLLSPDGSLTLQPRLRTLIVEDRTTVLDRVASLLDSFDIPPRNVEVTLSLFLGTDHRKTQSPRRSARTGALSKEVRGVIETLGDFTKWTAYEPLGSRSVTGVEGGEPVVANLSADYRVVFTVDSVQPVQQVVNLKRFSLQRLQREQDGSESIHNLYTTGMVLPMHKLHVVGAASDPGSNRALFLTLQVSSR